MKKSLSLSWYALTLAVMLTPFASVASSLTEEETARFETSIQHYCYFSQNLFLRVYDNNTLNTCYGTNDAPMVHAHDKFDHDIDAIRQYFYNNEQVQAINLFGNHIFDLCNKFGLRRYFVLSFPEKIDTTLPITKQLEQIEQAATALEGHYKNIKPQVSWQRVKEANKSDYYTFLTEKVLPELLIGAGIGLPIITLRNMFLENERSIMRYSKERRRLNTLLLCSITPIALYLLITKAIENAQSIKDTQKKNIDEKACIKHEQVIGFDQIKGHEDINDEMNMFVDFLKHPFKYKTKSGTLSVLLHGPSGTGKTLLARAIAKESGAPIITITADDILQPHADNHIREIWKLAEARAISRPEKSAIILVDEVDCVTGNRAIAELHPERSKALSNLIMSLDSIEKRNPHVHILIIFATSNQANLDPSLLRAGRIDHKLYIGCPDAEGRRAQLDDLLPKESKKHLTELVEKTDTFSGAMIVNFVEKSQMIASYHNRSIPSYDDYIRALDQIKSEVRDLAPAGV